MTGQHNRERVEADTTRSLTAQLRHARDALEQHGQPAASRAQGTRPPCRTAFRSYNQMAVRNFEDVRGPLPAGQLLSPTVQDYERVVRRGLDKCAPFLRGRNGAGDALLLERYGLTSSLDQ